MINRCKNILDENNIRYKNIEELRNEIFLVTLENDNEIIVKNIEDKEKIAWEYKNLLALQSKMRVPKIFKINDDYIKEASVIEKLKGFMVKTYEEKENAAFYLGNALGLLHVSEINEQSSEEELKKVWEKHILSKPLYYGTEIVKILDKKYSDKIFTYLNENMHYIKNDYDVTMLIGNITNEDYVVTSDRVMFNNFSNVMLGDATSDFAMIYDYFYDNKEQLEKFMNGYKDYMSIPDNFTNKLPFYKLINALDRLILLSNNKEENKESINNELDLIEAIINGKYDCMINIEE